VRWQNRRVYVALFCALAVIFYWLGPFSLNLFRQALDEEILDELLEQERQENLYYRLVDEDGYCIVTTGRRLKPGDCYLAEDNRLYEVYAVEGYLARARFKEKIELELPGGENSSGNLTPALPVQKPAYSIAIYHSHNAESYVPSDGTDSIYGRGGIHDVGVAFKESLTQKGIEVYHSERLHLPHDRGAYRRSRVTAQQLLKKRPDAIFDVHRDAAPWDAYAVEVDGEMVTRIQIVVGLSHPGAAANKEYAFDLKGCADRIYPGLVRGVFLIWGGYNQDLSPLNLLLEVGAHTNSKEAAMHGISLFGDVVAYYFYGPSYLDNGAGAAEPGREDGRPPALYRDAGGILNAISGTVLGLLLTSLGAALGFYFLNNPGALEDLLSWWERAPQRLALLPGRFKQFVLNFPTLARNSWADFPENLIYNWHRLRQEASAAPGWAKAAAQKWGRRAAGRIKIWIRELPWRWRRSWTLLLQESRELPAFLRHRLLKGRERLEHTASGLGRMVRRAWPLFRESLRLAWHRTLVEGAHWAALIREKMAMLRRLRT